MITALAKASHGNRDDLVTAICRPQGAGGPLFEKAAQAIRASLASPTTTVAASWDQHFTIYHDHLFAFARTQLAACGVVDVAAAQAAVESFHLRMLFGGFRLYVRSGATAFWPFACAAMATICREMNAGASIARN